MKSNKIFREVKDIVPEIEKNRRGRKHVGQPVCVAERLSGAIQIGTKN